MKSLFSAAVIVVLAISSAGCDLPFLNKDKDKTESSSPTSPSPGALDAFAGSWSSVTPSTPATGCGNVKYTVTPTSASSANVTFAGTCAGNIAVTGSGGGVLSGSEMTWNASGLVGQGGVNCPFTFNNNKATLDAAGQVVVAYNGTVCGIPVSGTETVRK